MSQVHSDEKDYVMFCRYGEWKFIEVCFKFASFKDEAFICDQ